MKKPTPFFRPFDLLWVILFLAVALVFHLLISLPQGDTLIIRQDGKITHSLSLQKDQTLSLAHHGYHLTVTVQNRQAKVTHSDCPDGICRNTPPIEKSGQTIVCLPAACSITVENQGEHPDAITY